MFDVVIVGGGPAGANCAYTLAKEGVHPVVFDPSHPREKPCGGMFTIAAAEQFPVIGELPTPHSEIDYMDLISPWGKKWKINLKNRLVGISRSKFDQQLLENAVKAGADLIKEKVVGIQPDGEKWRITTTDGTFEARIVIGADGVNSLVRKSILAPIEKRNLGACFGYCLKGVIQKHVTMKYSSKNSGYFWVIPRGDETSIGGGTSKLEAFKSLRNEVDSIIDASYSGFEKKSVWAALIPNFKRRGDFSMPVAGQNWAIIGDAAGHVSPISGAGIEFALLDGELAAQAIINGKVEQFNELWVESCGKALANETRLANFMMKEPFLDLYCIFAKVRSLALS